MAIRERDVRMSGRRFDVDVASNGNGAEQEAPIGDLLKRIGQDAGTLVKQEITLAKLELRESVKGLAKDAGKLGAAAGLGLLGAHALVAFVIIGLTHCLARLALHIRTGVAVLRGEIARATRLLICHSLPNLP